MLIFVGGFLMLFKHTHTHTHMHTHTHTHTHTHSHSSPQPPRDANPVLLFDTTDLPPLLVENFPFDKYELEPSPLTQYILGRRNPGICWQVCMYLLYMCFTQCKTQYSWPCIYIHVCTLPQKQSESASKSLELASYQAWVRGYTRTRAVLWLKMKGCLGFIKPHQM